MVVASSERWRYIGIWQQCTEKGTGLLSLLVIDILGTELSKCLTLVRYKISAQLRTDRETKTVTDNDKTGWMWRQIQSKIVFELLVGNDGNKELIYLCGPYSTLVSGLVGGANCCQMINRLGRFNSAHLFIYADYVSLLNKYNKVWPIEKLVLFRRYSIPTWWCLFLFIAIKKLKNPKLKNQSWKFRLFPRSEEYCRQSINLFCFGIDFFLLLGLWLKRWQNFHFTCKPTYCQISANRGPVLRLVDDTNSKSLYPEVRQIFTIKYQICLVNLPIIKKSASFNSFQY